MRLWRGRSTRQPLLQERELAVEASAPRARLVVFVHGIASAIDKRKDVFALVRESFPDADVLAPTFPALPSTNVDPRWVAYEITALIDQRHEELRKKNGDGYREIIVIGHSAGAAIARQAVLYSRGYIADHPAPEQGADIADGAWTKRIGRVILLAGVNRGWALDERPEAMPWLDFQRLRWFWFPLCRLPFWAALLRDLERGTPFMVNLRVQWMEAARNEELPPVFQILGDRHDMITRADAIDLNLSSKGICFVPLTNTGHLSILSFAGPEGERRRDKLIEIIGSPVEALIEEYREASQTEMAERLDRYRKRRKHDSRFTVGDVRHVVFVLHGIRDFGSWCKQVKELIEGRGNQSVAIVSSYGYFPMVRFLLHVSRQKKVRWFANEYVEARRSYPDAQIHFIGHSNGTYILGQALTRYRCLRFARVALAGSVLPREFDWKGLHAARRVGDIRNDCAASDAVVGIFPGFFARLGSALKWLRPGWLSDLGDGGFRGFTQTPVQGFCENQFFAGGHGAAVSPANHQSLVRYILDNVNEPGALRDRPTRFADFASRLNPLVVLAIVGLLVAVGYGVHYAAGDDWLPWTSAYVALVLLIAFLV